MCGGLVLLAGAGKRAPVLGQLLYHLGRGFSYIVLGYLAGSIGELFIQQLQHHSGLSTPWAGILVGAILLVAVAIGAMVARGAFREQGVVTLGAAAPRWSAMLRRVTQTPILLGFVTPLLPCPWLYSFVALAAASGSSLNGMQLMGAFWIGTLPALLVAGTLFESSLRVFLAKYPRIVVASLVVAVLSSLASHLFHDHHAHHGHYSGGSAEGHGSHHEHHQH